MADFRVPYYLQGVSLVPLIENPDTEWKTGAFRRQDRLRKVIVNLKTARIKKYVIKMLYALKPQTATI